MNVEKLLMLTQKEENMYSYLAIVAPVAIAYYLSSEDFPENNYLLLLFVLFYTLIFHIIYRIYCNHRKIIKKRVVNKMAPSFFEMKKDIILMKSQLETMGEKGFSKKTNNSTIFISVYDAINRQYYYMSKRYETLIKIIEEMQHKIDHIDEKRFTEKFDWTHYKKFDYLLMFTASLILIFKLVPFSSPIPFEPINSVSLIVLFFIVIIFYTFWTYIKYYYYLMLLKFGIFLLPRAKSFLNTLIIKKASPSK
jgi:hypothetical protein